MDYSNIAAIINQTINSLLESFISSIDMTIYNYLDNLIFINSDILNTSSFDKILGCSSSTGLILISNSFLLGFVIYYCIRYFYSNYTSQPIESPHHFILKLLICSVLINSSFYICEEVININSLFSISIQDLGKSIFNTDISFSNLIIKLNKNIYSNEAFNIFSFEGLIKSLVSFSFLNLILSYAIRYIMIKLFFLLTPFSFLTLLNKNTNWFFRSWLKNLFSLLIIQHFVYILLLIIFSIDYNLNIFSKIVFVGSIYSLVYINSFIRQFVGGISTDINNNLNFSSYFFGNRRL